MTRKEFEGVIQMLALTGEEVPNSSALNLMVQMTDMYRENPYMPLHRPYIETYRYDAMMRFPPGATTIDTLKGAELYERAGEIRKKARETYLTPKWVESIYPVIGILFQTNSNLSGKEYHYQGYYGTNPDSLMLSYINNQYPGRGGFFYHAYKEGNFFLNGLLEIEEAAEAVAESQKKYKVVQRPENHSDLPGKLPLMLPLVDQYHGYNGVLYIPGRLSFENRTPSRLSKQLKKDLKPLEAVMSKYCTIWSNDLQAIVGNTVTEEYFNPLQKKKGEVEAIFKQYTEKLNKKTDTNLDRHVRSTLNSLYWKRRNFNGDVL